MASEQVSEQDISKKNVLQRCTTECSKRSRIIIVAAILFVAFCIGVMTGVAVTNNSHGSLLLNHHWQDSKDASSRSRRDVNTKSLTMDDVQTEIKLLLKSLKGQLDICKFDGSYCLHEHRGDLGDDGPPGPPGKKGVKGDASAFVGEKGLPGPPGPPGQAGPPGPLGKCGKPGSGGKLRGHDGNKGEPGLDGQKGDIGRRGRHGFGGERAVKGELGFPGEPGAKGETGVPGADGFPGLKGQAGMPGTPEKCIC